MRKFSEMWKNDREWLQCDDSTGVMLCSDLLAVIDRVLSLPASTADCDRGFSTIKMVKSDWWSSPLSDTLFRSSDYSTLLPRNKTLI